MDLKKIKEFEDLLKEVEALQQHAAEPKTYMEVARYPHRETVYSNILAYFLDPGETHGFGSLALKALLVAAGSRESEDRESTVHDVETEVLTEAGNRIDIVVKTDDHIIGIENKVFATADNPFADYTEYLEKQAEKQALTVLKILLSLGPRDAPEGWVLITYDDLFSKTLPRFANAASDLKQLTIFLDFVTTIRNLTKESRPMNQELLTLLKDDAVERFLHEILGAKKTLREKVERLDGMIRPSDIPYWKWRPTDKIQDFLGATFDVREGLKIEASAMVSPNGWEVSVRATKKGQSGHVEHLLDELRIETVAHKEEGRRLVKTFAFDDDEQCVAEQLSRLAGKLAKHAEVP